VADIRYVQGDATDPQGDGPKIIAHVCNDAGLWGAGFVLALSARWPEPEEAYRAWHMGYGAVPFGLGRVQFVRVAPRLQVANMIGQYGVYPDGKGRPPVRYEAVSAALGKAGLHALGTGASVHMPRIGCGLAGGKWELIEPLLQENLVRRGISVTVYDIPAEDLADAEAARRARAEPGPDIPWERVKAEAGLL